MYLRVMTLVWILFFSGQVDALEGSYERLTGKAVVSFSSSGDWTYELKEGRKKWTEQGVYEETACWRASGDQASDSGTHMFYKSDGEKCCMRIKAIASKVLLERIAGDYGLICTGGVFQSGDD